MRKLSNTSVVLSVLSLLATVALVAAPQQAHAQVSAEVPDTAAIINGVETPGSAVTGALLFVGPDIKNQFYECSGVLIGCRSFLTAAHCICKTSDDAAHCEANELRNLDTADLRVFLPHAGIYHVRGVSVSPDYQRGLRSDLAYIRISDRVDGIKPATINDTRIRIDRGAPGVIVGYGTSNDNDTDIALKRTGDIEVADCPDSILEPANICWLFENPVGRRGSDSNVCRGDDGGALLVDLGDGPVLAGVLAAGGPTCSADSYGLATSVFKNHGWLRGVGGRDIERNTCSDLPEIGDDLTIVDSFSDRLPRNGDEVGWSFDVPDRGRLLRLTVNGDTEPHGDYDMFVKFGSPPSKTDYDCASRGVGQFGACSFDRPEEGKWFVLVKHVRPVLDGRGHSKFQVTASIFRNPLPPGPTPKTPERLRAKKRSTDRYRLRWRDKSDNEDGFEIQRKIGNEVNEFFSYAITPPNRDNYTDQIDTELIYTYRVRAFNGHGFSDWTNECIVNEPRPLRPTKFRTDAVSGTEVSMIWHDASNNESGFQLQRRLLGNDKWKNVAILGQNESSYIDRGVRSGRTYEYRVRARGRLENCVRNSRWSHVLTVDVADN